jgi:pyroglutamyl-peptidase
MTTLLITGFGPFPGVPVNPTERLARRLGESGSPAGGDVRRVVRILPTSWAMPAELEAILAKVRPDAVLAIGVARRRPLVTPERIGRNRATASRKDVSGARQAGGVLVPDGPPQAECRIDVAKVAAGMRRAGAPARVSWSAGAYLCNALAYSLYRRETPALFIHVPMPAEMRAPVPDRPSEALILKALEAAVAAMPAAAAGPYFVPTAVR